MTVLTTVSLFLLSATTVQASVSEQTVHNFNYTDGTNPYGGVILDSDGNLYGTASENGSTGAGTVYEVLSNGSGPWGYEVLYNFCSVPSCPDGAIPQSTLIFDAAGNLYGTTSQGGNSGCGHGCGTVFELSPSFNGGWTEKVLYTFTGGSDGATPVSGLVMDSSGNLYGTTSAGGPSSIYCEQGCGVIFRLQSSPNGTWTQSVLHSFCLSTGCPDGAIPNGLNFDSSGNLYCTTSQLGRYNGGTVLRFTPNQKGNWNTSLLHAFGHDVGLDGDYPNPGLVVDPTRNIYGTTSRGGKYFFGTIFELIPVANGEWTEKILHNFCSATNCADGGFPLVGMTQGSPGRLYGTTLVAGEPYGFGTVFTLAMDKNGHWNFVLLYDSVSANLNGPITPDTAGNLFSTTSNGGEFGLGSVIQVIP